MDKDLLIEIGKRVREKRRELGLSQEELAIMSGFSSKGAISKIEKGTRAPHNKMNTLAKALGVSPDYLLGWEKNDIEKEEPNLFVKEMGQRIRAKRLEIGYSQQELAEKCKFNGRSAVSMIELGLRDISHEKMFILAKALRTTPHFIMGWESQIDKPLAQIEIEDRLSNLTEGQLKAILSIVKEMEG